MLSLYHGDHGAGLATCADAGATVMTHAESRSVVQADLYSALTPFNATYAFFADWLERRGERIVQVLGVHHEPLPAATLIEQARRWRAVPRRSHPPEPCFGKARHCAPMARCRSTGAHWPLSRLRP